MKAKYLGLVIVALLVFMSTATLVRASTAPVVSQFNFSIQGVNKLAYKIGDPYTSNNNYKFVRVNVTGSSGGDKYDLSITNLNGSILSKTYGLVNGKTYKIDFSSQYNNYCRVDANITESCNSGSSGYCLKAGDIVRVRIDNQSWLGGAITVNGSVQFQN